jgi:DNA-binding PadR family transcriptional regulator
MMTDAELTLLSLLAESPRYGYELQQLVEERGLREWLTIGFASIYYLLNKLEEQTLITSELRSDGRGPARKYYELTENGRGILQTALIHLLREPRLPGSGFELGLANLHVLKPAQVYNTLRQHRADMQHQLAAMTAAWVRYHQQPQLDMSIQALYTHNIAIMQAEIQWLDDFLVAWQNRYPAVVKEVAKKKMDDETLRTAKTLLSQPTPPNKLKMIQRLKRIPPNPTDD